jgi:hypothetical protein
MRVAGVRIRGWLVVSQGKKSFSTNWNNSHNIPLGAPNFSPPLQFPRRPFSMATEEHKWSALRVRETFLDYFKNNGHTFGA